MLETSLSKPPARTSRNCSHGPAQFSQQALWKTAKRDVQEGSPSSKCPHRTKRLRLSSSLTAKKSVVVRSKLTKPNHARTAAEADVALAVIAAALVATTVAADVKNHAGKPSTLQSTSETRMSLALSKGIYEFFSIG